MFGALVDAGFILSIGAVYASVAWRLRGHQRSDPQTQRALIMFRLWWSGIAALFFTSGASGALRALGVADRATHATLIGFGFLGLCLGLWGILHYVTYLYAGRSSFFLAYFAYYSAIFAALLYGIASDGSQVEAWQRSVTKLVILTGPYMTALIVAFLMPVIIACGFYFSLWFRLKDRAQKFRVGATSIAFISWFGSAILASALGLADEAWWALVGRAIGLVASALILLAYWPPRRLREGAGSFVSRERTSP